MAFLIFGIGCGYAISGFIVDSSSSSNNIGHLMVIESMLCLIALIFNFFLFKNSPNKIEIKEKLNIKAHINMAFSNKDYIYLLVSSSIVNASTNYYAILLEIISSKFDYSTEASTVFFMCTILFGILGCMICSHLTTADRKYKIICLITIGFTIIFGLTLYFAMESRLLYLPIINSCIFGLFFMAAMPLSLEFAYEVSFPVNAIVSAGFINCFGGLMSMLPLLIAYFFNNEPLSSIIILLIFQLIAFIFIAIINEPPVQTKGESNSIEEIEQLNLIKSS